MADLNELRKVLRGFESSLKTTSLDDHDRNNPTHLCRSDQEVYNFDQYIQNLYHPKPPKSFDALYIPNHYQNVLVCIEFKNMILSDLSGKKMRETCEKYETGLKEIRKIFLEKHIPINQCYFEIFIICKNSSSGREISRDKLQQSKEKEKTFKCLVVDKLPFFNIKFHILRIQECKKYYREFFPSNCL